MAEKTKAADEKKVKKASKEEKPAKKEAKVEVPKEDKTEAKKDEKVESKKGDKTKEKKDKKAEKVDIVSETIYMIPLTKVHRTKPDYKRTRKAVNAVRNYLIRHTKSKEIRLDEKLNRHIWARGDTKPPRRVQVKATKDSKGKVIATLLG